MKPNVLQTPHWISAEEAQSQMPVAAWELISYAGSLTERLRQMTNHKTTFHLLFANWGHANPLERQILNLSIKERTWIRCIEHRCNGNLWVYGHTVFPESTIAATKEVIPRLGIQSLGDILFKDPKLKRTPFSYCLLDKNDAYYPVSNAWARRSVLYFQDQPLLITEIFTSESYASLSS